MTIEVIRYEWNHGANYRVPADVAAAIFEGIRERDGTLTPEAIVAVSQAPDAPLHNEFEWDDQAAATAYRRDQAKGMIRHMVVVHRHPETSAEIPTRLYVSLNQLTGARQAAGHYAVVHDVLADEGQRQALLEQARHDLERWRERYKHLRELAGAREAVEQALEALAAT